VACTWRPGPGTGLRHPEVLTDVVQTLTDQGNLAADQAPAT